MNFEDFSPSKKMCCERAVCKSTMVENLHIIVCNAHNDGQCLHATACRGNLIAFLPPCKAVSALHAMLAQVLVSKLSVTILNVCWSLLQFSEAAMNKIYTLPLHAAVPV